MRTLVPTIYTDIRVTVLLLLVEDKERGKELADTQRPRGRTLVAGVLALSDLRDFIFELHNLGAVAPARSCRRRMAWR